MDNIPEELKYSQDHEWVRVEGNRAVIGVTDFAQQSLGDIVFVELPAVGDQLAADDTFGVVESVKTASDLNCPVSGTVVEVNESLVDSPELVNQEPYGQAWMMVIEMADPAELANLLSAEQYQAMIEEGN